MAPYIIKFYIDGGCRNNGKSNPIASAAVVHENKWGRVTYQTIALPSFPTPTNQRAELMAIILALQWAIERWDDLGADRPKPKNTRVIIHADSKYAIGCMTKWLTKWQSNGWINAAGRPVANKELIQEAVQLEEELRGRKDGVSVRYEWVPREENKNADRFANERMDEMASQL